MFWLDLRKTESKRRQKRHYLRRRRHELADVNGGANLQGSR
jgi:hypothetical protein